ncbi:hypothetical protein [Streptomyces parvus]|uniref:hypothetical protein n=1 Tax=Streptomyces parvus TaxID=66428 RepID=UPI00340E78E1
MRDEVFRVEGPRTRTQAARWIEIEGEPWWALVDLLVAKGQPRALAKNQRVLDQIDPQLREQVWVLEPGHLRPMAAWFVNEAGRAALGDVFASRPTRRRRTYTPSKRRGA